jgi:hypothetical protein
MTKTSFIKYFLWKKPERKLKIKNVVKKDDDLIIDLKSVREKESNKESNEK